MSNQLIPAGFYPDPENPSKTRWWDGQAWADASSDEAPAEGAAAPAAPQAPSAPAYAAAPAGPSLVSGLRQKYVPAGNAALAMLYTLSLAVAGLGFLVWLIGIIIERWAGSYWMIVGSGVLSIGFTALVATLITSAVVLSKNQK